IHGPSSPDETLFLQMTIRKSDVLDPIVFRKVMPSGANVVSDVDSYRRVLGWHLPHAQARLTEEAIYRFGMQARQELALRVGPQVLGGAGHVHRTGCYGSQEHVLVDRQGVFTVVVLLEVAGKPVGKRRVDDGYRLAELPPAEGRAATAGVVRDSQGKPLVLGRGPKGRLTEARVA